MRYPTFVLFVVAACGSSGNNNPKVDAGPDAKIWMDAPPSVPAMITISGTAVEQGQNTNTPLPGVKVAVFKRSNESTPLGMATSDAQGKYSIQVTTGGMVVDGYVKATISGHPDSYAFPAIPWQADDTSADPQMITQSNYDQLSLFILSRQAGQGLVIVNVTDASGHGVAGASIATSPASPHYAYMDPSSGIPNASLTMTATDGIAFAAGMAPGEVMLNATKSGSTFKSHALNIHADAFTTTSITE